MRTTNPSLSSDQVERVRVRFERWRQSRPGRSRIPQALWLSAAELARDHGLNRTARALGLDYYSLKEHLESTDAPECGPQTIAPKFVELMPSASAAASECSVELENARGAKLKIQVKDASTAHLTVLSDLFWKVAQ
jgi:hypothetical protein